MNKENKVKIEIENGIRIQIDKENHTASVIDIKSSGDVFIPRNAVYKGEKYKITSIERLTFNHSKINTLSFPTNSEIQIFNNSFFSTTIKKLQIPPKLYEIDFSGVDMLEEIEISPKNNFFIYFDNKYLLGKTNKNSDVYDILYFGNFNIEEAIIPPQIKILKENSFCSHSKLKSIIIPENSQLQEIQSNAFSFTPISKLVLPVSLKKIGGTFGSTENLIDIEIPPENPNFSLIENKFLLQKNDETNQFDILIFCRRDVEHVIIPSNIKRIEKSSISYCSKLQSITFEPNSTVDTLCDEAFSQNDLLKNIIIPPSVKFVGEKVFAYNKNLESIEFLGDNLSMKMNSFDFLHDLFSQEKREVLISFPNATNLEFEYGYLNGDFAKVVIIKVNHDAKLTGRALPDIQNRIKYFGDEDEDDKKDTEIQEKVKNPKENINKEKVKNKNENKKNNILMKHIRYLENRLRKYEKVIPFDPQKVELEEEDQEKEIGKDKKEIEKLKQELDLLKDKIKKLEQKSDNKNNQTVNIEIFEANAVDLLKVIKTIGRGAQSEVYEVSREQHFALKVLYLESAKKSAKKRLKSKNKKETVDQLNDLLHEYEIINALNHRNIIRMFGFCFGDEKHSPSILLQYCSNNLNDIVEEMSDIERVCAIFEISSGMEAVHAVNCIHKILKPENILFDEEGHIRISDFGISYFSDDQEQLARIGSIKFSAPELLNGKTDYNNKIDVYSFGVIVFFILTCGQTPKISIGDQSSGKKAPIPKKINKISRDLINRCWSTNPVDRPSFKEINDYITSKKFKLIDGIENNMKEIKTFLSI